MNRIKDIFNKGKLYFIFIFLFLFIFVLMLIIKKYIPFGSNNYLIGDLEIQEYPFLIDMKNSILSGEINYSWHGGFGAPFYRLFFNYMSSPLNIIALFFNNKNIVVCIHILVLLKSALAGLAFIFYTIRKYNSNDLIILVPALLYSFCGYFLLFFFFLNSLYIFFF